jgi:hypothetical protein
MVRTTGKASGTSLTGSEHARHVPVFPVVLVCSGPGLVDLSADFSAYKFKFRVH